MKASAPSGGATAPAGIYQIGNAGAGLPTTAGQPETLLIQVPQSNPLDITSSDKPMSPFGFYMADLSDGNPTDPINGENVAYVADAEMGIARYDYSQTAGESSPQWKFSYYIDSTGSFKDSVYTVDRHRTSYAHGQLQFDQSDPGFKSERGSDQGRRR